MLERLKYRLSEHLNKGIGAQILLLTVLTVGLICFLALVVFALQPVSFFESIWEVTSWVLDPGTYSDTIVFSKRIVALLATLFGILLMSSLIGLISAAIIDNIERVRNGIGKVSASDYTLIIGWNYRIFTLINELITANENQDSHTIVVLSSVEKNRMDNDIRLNVNLTKGIKILTRSIDLLTVSNYSLISIQEARSIILLSDSSVREDVGILKMLIILDKMLLNQEIPIVFEISSFGQYRTISPILKENHYSVVKENVFSQALVQVMLQSGLTRVFNELFSFDGAEIYIYDIPAQFVGRSYAAMVMGVTNGSVIGILNSNSETLLNPTPHFRISSGDKVILVLEDDDPLEIMEYEYNNEHRPSVAKKDLFTIENILILGFNNDLKDILNEICSYTETFFTVHVVSDSIPNGYFINSEKYKFIPYNNRHFDYEFLTSLDYNKYDRILILNCDYISPEESDTYAISAFSMLKDIFKKLDDRPKVTLQLAVENNRGLLESDMFSDFLVSDSIISGMLAQLSENPLLTKCYEELINHKGCELYFIPLNLLVEKGESSRMTVLEAYEVSVGMGFSLVGVKLISTDDYRIVLNPHKECALELSELDELIVIASL